MHRMSRRAAAIAPRPLAIAIAGAALTAGLLVLPAPAGQAAQTAGHASPTTGVITGMLHGITGQPADGVCVTASGPAGDAVARSQPDGRYRLTGLRPGRYALRISPCPGTASVEPPLASWTSLPTTATVTAGHVTTPTAAVSWQLSRNGALSSGGTLSATAQSTTASTRKGKKGSISGKVTGQGKGLSAICVAALSVRSGMHYTTVSSKSGAYRIVKLPAARYIVLFFAGAKQCPNTGNWLEQWYPSAKVEFPTTRDAVKVQAGKDTAGIDAQLKAGGQIGGTVRSASGKPQAGICVIAADVVKPGLNKFAESVSGTSGGYVLHGLAPGTYKEIFSLGCGNHGNFAIQWWKHSTDRKHSKNLMLKGQRHLSGIDASLRPGAVVTGTVRAGNAKRNLLANVCVFAVSDAALNEPEAVTGTHGRYKLIGLSTGTYTIGYQPSCGRRSDTGFLSARRHLRVTEGRTMRGVNVALIPTSGLSGTVTDIHGQPLGGVCVTMDGSGDRATTKADGSYSIKGIRPGSYSVRFAGGCGNKPSIVPQFYNGTPDADAATKVTFKPGKVTSGIDATMQPGGIITGLITDSAGHPLPHVCAGISGESESESGGVVRSDVRTGDKGRYEIKNVVPGPWRLALRVRGRPERPRLVPGAELLDSRQPAVGRSGSHRDGQRGAQPGGLDQRKGHQQRGPDGRPRLRVG